MNGSIASLDAIHFADGTSIEVPNPGVTVIVGPNNAGKTALLRELGNHLGLGNESSGPKRIVIRVDMSFTDDHSVALSYLHTVGHRVPSAESEPAKYMIRGRHLDEQTFLDYFPKTPIDVEGHGGLAARLRRPNQPNLRRTLAPLVVFDADLESRTATSTAVSLHNILTDAPSMPLHYLYVEPELEREVSELASRNFGSRLMLNRLGTQLELYLGSTSEVPMQNNVPNQRYIEAFHQMQPLSQQGHGVRSFMGLYLSLRTRPYPIVIIDEPEAFLHPPQARALGFEIARLSHENRSQAVIATHSLDLLKGVLDYQECPSSVVRLTRNGNVNHVSHLSTDLIRTVWSDPLLRFSGVLDGLFYQLTILCEGDPDCRFFSAVGSTMKSRDDLFSASEVNFVPVGGKQRFPVALTALRAINVPVRVLADFDLIRDRQELVRLVEAAGGREEDIDRDWRVGVSSIAAAGTGVPIESLRSKIKEILDQAGNRLDPPTKKSIAGELVTNDAWSNLKRVGLAGVPPADARVACERLLATLNGLGIFPSPFGELESFVPQVSGHGPAWLAEVLHERLYESCDNAVALLELSLTR